MSNGVDASKFHADPSSGRRLRDRLGVAADVPVVGAVGRYHPLKGYDILLEAFARVDGPDAHLVLVGTGNDRRNDELVANVRRAGLTDRVHLLGPQSDVAGVLTGLDLLVSASQWESLPNVVLEALACRTPVVATDAGDLSVLGNPRGLTTVCAGDPAALAEAITAALRCPERPDGIALRDHARVAADYEALYAEIAERSPRWRAR